MLYRARDTRLGRTVAIKLLRPEVVADPERTRRFLQEARAVSALNHPNIVTIHDIGEDPERGTWIAMECLDGESLRQRLARGRLAVPEALRIAVEIARGLAAAHAAGIVHRDVKPANVMITSSGLVKVLDFGLAKLVGPGRAIDSVAPTMSAPPRPGWACSSAPPPTCRPSRPRAAPRTPAPTSSPSARCSTRCSRGSGPSRGRAGCRSSPRSCRTRLRRCGASSPRWTRGSRRWSTGAWRRTPAPAIPRPRRCCRTSRPASPATLAPAPASSDGRRGWPVSACFSSPSWPWGPGPGAATPGSGGRAARRCPRSSGSSTPTRSRARSAWPRRRGPSSRATRSSRGCGWTSPRVLRPRCAASPRARRFPSSRTRSPMRSGRSSGRRRSRRWTCPGSSRASGSRSRATRRWSSPSCRRASRAIPPSGSCPRTRPLRGWCSCPAAASSTGTPPRWSCPSSGSTAPR